MTKEEVLNDYKNMLDAYKKEEAFQHIFHAGKHYERTQYERELVASIPNEKDQKIIYQKAMTISSEIEEKYDNIIRELGIEQNVDTNTVQEFLEFACELLKRIE